MVSARGPALLALVLLLTASAAGTAAAEDPAQVRIYRDSNAQFLAVSVFGDSSAAVAASGTGNAGGLVAASGTGNAAGIVAVAPDGHAVGTVPVTVLGTCNFRDCAEVQTSGGADGYYLAASTGQESTAGLAAASGGGSARCSGLAPACVAVTGTHEARGGAALAGTGDAFGTFLGVSGTGDSEGLVAVTGFGDAHGYVSASGTGHAEWGPLSVGGCDVLEGVGVGEACGHPASLLP